MNVRFFRSQRHGKHYDVLIESLALVTLIVSNRATLFTFKCHFVHLMFLQIPELGVAKYASQILSVIVALIEDAEEEVALEAVQGLGKVSDILSN